MTGFKKIFVFVILINTIVVCMCQRVNNNKAEPVQKNFQGEDVQVMNSGSVSWTDGNGNFRRYDFGNDNQKSKRDVYEDHPLFRRRRSISPNIFRQRRQIPGVGGAGIGGGMGIGDLTGINQMVRFKPYKFTGRRRMNPELLFPGAVIGDGVSQPIGSFSGIGYLGESDLVGLAPTIYDRLPMPNLFQSSYPGLMPGMMPDAAAQAAAAGLSDRNIFEDSDSESLPLGPLGNDLDELELDLDRR